MTHKPSAMKAIELANRISEHASVAFWTGETDSSPGGHLKYVDYLFCSLAEHLGYRVERITEEETA